MKPLVYFAVAVCFQIACTASANETTQQPLYRRSSHAHHHNHHRYADAHRNNHIDDHYGALSRPLQHHQDASAGNNSRNQSRTAVRRVSSVNTKLQAITSPSKSPTNSLRLSLIQTNGQAFVANNYDAFNTHFHRWPIASQSPSTDFDIAWRPANNPFGSHFNPSVDSVPISTAANKPIAAITTTTMPAANGRRIFTDNRAHGKHHTGLGRHICIDYKAITSPAAQDNRVAPCRNGSNCELNGWHSNSITSRRLDNTKLHTVYNCCPGWTKLSKHSHGCTKPICKIPCKNNGKCVKPEQCSCPAGYTGRHCELDVNECETEKPCDQMCHNTEGSFYCTCRLGFILYSDRQSCKKIDSSFGNDDTGTAFEARDLENDVDNDDLATRVNNIEKLMITEKERNVATDKLMQHTLAAVNSLKHDLNSLETRQHELSLLRDRLKSFEIGVNKLQYSVDLLFKCRNKPLIYCPQ